MPLHNHLWIARRKIRPKAFPQSHAEWWTAGPPQRNKTCRRARFFFYSIPAEICLLFECKWGLTSAQPESMTIGWSSHWQAVLDRLCDLRGCSDCVHRTIYLQTNEEKYLAECQYTWNQYGLVPLCYPAPLPLWRSVRYNHDSIMMRLFCRWEIYHGGWWVNTVPWLWCVIISTSCVSHILVSRFSVSLQLCHVFIFVFIFIILLSFLPPSTSPPHPPPLSPSVFLSFAVIPSLAFYLCLPLPLNSVYFPSLLQSLSFRLQDESWQLTSVE